MIDDGCGLVLSSFDNWIHREGWSATSSSTSRQIFINGKPFFCLFMSSLLNLYQVAISNYRCSKPQCAAIYCGAPKVVRPQTSVWQERAGVEQQENQQESLQEEGQVACSVQVVGVFRWPSYFKGDLSQWQWGGRFWWVGLSRIGGLALSRAAAESTSADCQLADTAPAAPASPQLPTATARTLSSSSYRHHIDILLHRHCIVIASSLYHHCIVIISLLYRHHIIIILIQVCYLHCSQRLTLPLNLFLGLVLSNQ